MLDTKNNIVDWDFVVQLQVHNYEPHLNSRCNLSELEDGLRSIESNLGKNYVGGCCYPGTLLGYLVF